jgi:pentatricopeptide repeat protein
MSRKSVQKSRRQNHSRIVRKWDGRPASTTPRTSMRTLQGRLRDDPENVDARLALADRLLMRDKAEEALALLNEECSPLHSASRAMEYWQAARIKAFALARLGQHAEARELGEEMLREYPGAPDALYILAYTTNRLGDWTASRDYAVQFMESVAESSGRSAPPEFCGTVSRTYEVSNYLGVALDNLGSSDAAIDAFSQAIAEKPDCDAAWVNLIRCQYRHELTEDGAQTYRDALKACPRSRALKALGKSKREKSAQTDKHSDSQKLNEPSIALCMIVKNEEEHLPRALASAKRLVDQMIVVDTGSTDRTVEIAKSFGADVYFHEWEGDFSKARNISMGYADADWILILDADEELVKDDLKVIRQTIRETDFRAISMSVYNFSREKQMYTSFLPSVRLFRRDLGAYYDGIVHNQLRFPTEEGVLRIPARILHYGYGLSPEQMARKVERSRTLLEQQLRENPDNAFAHFNLAQLLRGSEETPSPAMMDKVIFHAGRAVDMTSPDLRNERHIHLMALHQLCTACFNKGDFERAAEYAHQALAHKPGYLDAILSLGHIHSMDRQLDLAKKYYLEYLDLQRSYDEHAETDHVILLHLRSRHNAYYGLGLIAEMQGDNAEAVGWYDRCIEERHDYIDVHYRLGVVLSNIGQKDRARKEFTTELNCHPDNVDARIALAGLCFEVNDTETAIECLREGLEYAPDSAPLAIRLGEIDFAARRYRDVIRSLEIVDLGDPGFDHACRLRADSHFELRQFDQAVDLYTQCLERTPGDIDVMNNLANCYFRLGNYTEAEKLYQRIIDAGHASVHVYRNLGLTQSRLEKTDDAIFTLESYAQLDPNDIEAAGFLGDLYYGSKLFGKAIDEYERVLERQPNRPDTLTRLGDCYLNQGAVAAALVGYERALDADPDYKPAWDRLREVREQLVARITRMPQSPVE